MKALAMLIVAALALAGCTTSGGDPIAKLDAAIQKAAPGTCTGVTTLYTAYVASNLGSEKDKATVDAAWQTISPICNHPSQITSAELLIVAAQTAAIIRVVRAAKVKANA